MPVPQWLKQILDILKKEGKVPANHTGKVNISYNLSQGGIQDVEVNSGEKFK